MTPVTPFSLIFNSLTLALSMGFLIIIVWYDARRTVNQFFAIFLIFLQLWNIGILLGQVAPLITDTSTLTNVSYGLSQAGFAGSSISLYGLMTVLAGVQPRRFRLMTFVYIVLVIGYGGILIRSEAQEFSRAQITSFALFFFTIFDFLTLHILWTYRRKLRTVGLSIGVVMFIIGQGVSFLNPELGITTLSATLSSLGALVTSFSIIERELIKPLLERGSQFESMHEVGLAITQGIATDAFLTEIAERAADWLDADASAIWLIENDLLNVVAAHNLPANALGRYLPPGEGVAGSVADSKKSIYLENYGRDWNGVEDLPLAKDTFGSIICVPLIYDNAVIGVLMVVSGLRNVLLDPADLHLVELLGSQAAIAISYGVLFNEQRNLTKQLELAKRQLETVLTSTENPVLAVDRSLNLIFTNPAAESLFSLDTIHSRANVRRVLPSYTLPKDFRRALRSIRERGSFRYEIELDGKTYLCHVTTLGKGYIEGFVAIMNDVTELKELDRIKSEMVRMTSHDLKNPLQAALANLELLRDDLQDVEDDEITLSVNNIDKQLNRMNRIIGGILDLERVRLTANLEEVCRPARVVQAVFDELSDMAKDNAVTLIADVHPATADFVGDVDQFKRALINLVENAIKFNRPGGEVKVRVHNLSLNVIFIISDTGIGIPEDLISKIFDRFYRAHQPGAEHISGSGLGLSLVKAVVESHGGQLWVESQFDVGTTFTITVPAAQRDRDAVS